MSGNKKELKVTVLPRTSEDSETSTKSYRKAPSLASPRTARFAEATAVHSPIEPSKTANPFGRERTVHLMAQPQVSDLGFGYMNKHESVEMPDTGYQPPVTARAMPKSPGILKSAMKTPGAPPRDFGNAMLSPTFKEEILSPTFKEEEVLEKSEQFTEIQQAKDVKVKTRVRIAKFLLRGVNFSCSLIVLGMLTSTFAIFRATKNLPPRNNLPPWAANQQTWPQILLLSIACVSLFASLIIFYAYWRGGHRKAEKKAVYYTIYSVVFFIFSIVMWIIGAVVIQQAKNTGNNKDMWGWSCVNNARSQLFQNDVAYDLICRLQNWSLVCAIIEIVVEVITLLVYGVTFYRYYSKRQLRKTMAARDNARSQLYIAQLRTQPNTPAPFSPRDGGWRAPSDESYKNASQMEDGDIRYISADQKKSTPAPFKLQAPPIKITGATPKVQQLGFTPIDTATAPRMTTVTVQSRSRTPSPQDDQRSPLIIDTSRPSTAQQSQPQHLAAAPGEQVYESVPIPGAYEAPLSPGFERPGMQFPRM